MSGPVVLSMLWSCSDGVVLQEPRGDDSASSCVAPTANAGDDAEASLGQQVTLDGSRSEACDGADISTLEFQWGLSLIPENSAIDEADVTASHTASPSFTPDAVGDYILVLSVHQSVNGVEVTSGEDMVVVHVVAGSQPPIGDCGGNQTGRVGERSSFDGSASADPEGAPLAYTWSLTAPECSSLGADGLDNASTSTASLLPDCAGTFIAALVVSDGEQGSEPVFCSLEALGASDAPIADADGGDVCDSSPHQLDGWGSYDPEGAALTWVWSVVSVPSGSTGAPLDNALLPDPSFTWDVAGDYTFSLQVYDGDWYSVPDAVTVTCG